MFFLTYLTQIWSVHIQSDPSHRSGRSPHDRQGWRYQNLTQENLISTENIACAVISAIFTGVMIAQTES